MHDPVDETPRCDAAARRRRMQRRFARRRAKKVATALALAVTMVTALRPAAPAAASATASAALAPDTLGIRLIPRIADVREDSHPLWRPAGAVLKRNKVSAAPPVAFAPEVRERERHESLSRWHGIYGFSTRYRIKPDLARRIYDAAVSEGIEPELGFRLVRVESVFNPSAVSPAGALGLTQLMPGTAREFEPNVTREQLLDPDVNLRIGFRYLRTLIRTYKGDLKLALLVYNRGPVAVHNALAMGQSPANGYESIVTRGYRGRGTLD
jgi:soluble lytic murein transglycosylase-like protein